MKKTGIVLVKYGNRVFGEGAAPDYKTILEHLLKTAYKVPEAEIAEIFKDGATSETVKAAVIDVDKKRVVKLTDAQGVEKYQEGYKKAKGEALADNEQKLREKYSIEEPLRSEELYERIRTDAAKAAGADASNEEAVKKHPAYLAMEKKLKKDLTDATTAHETKIKEIEDGRGQETLFSEVRGLALATLEELGAVLPKDQKVADKQKQFFLNEFKAYKWEKVGEDLIATDKDGKKLVDAHGNTLSFKDLSTRLAGETFELSKNSGGNNGGNNNDNGGAAAPPAGYPASVKAKPKSMEELSAIMQNTEIPAKDRRIVKDTYDKEYGIKK